MEALWQAQEDATVGPQARRRVNRQPRRDGLRYPELEGIAEQLDGLVGILAGGKAPRQFDDIREVAAIVLLLEVDGVVLEVRGVTHRLLLCESWPCADTISLAVAH